jgi:hypothetical protein
MSLSFMKGREGTRLKPSGMTLFCWCPDTSQTASFALTTHFILMIVYVT